VRLAVQAKDRVSSLKLRITAAAEKIIRSGHPWLFAESILEQNRAGGPGEIAVIYDKQDRFLAAALYDPDSPIRARVLQLGKPRKIDVGWWSERAMIAMRRREGLFDAKTNGYRLINGESDGWPGLILDRYADSLVLKLYTAAWLPRLGEIVRVILEAAAMESAHPCPDRDSKRDRDKGVRPTMRVVLRLSRNIEENAARVWKRRDGELLNGESLNNPVVFLENGLRFEADVRYGQKTGFFLDQRDNRKRIGAMAGGRTVLNAFSFTGGFSVYSAAGGARSVTDLDISAHALEGGRRNLALNEETPHVDACVRQEIKADAFDWLGQERKEKFGLVILDPPSLAKRESERTRAIEAYSRLAEMGIKRLSSDGILLACSCSAHVTADEFFAAVLEAARKCRRKFQELDRTGHAPDHHATFKEAEYLKGIYLRLGKAG
jgi:23S rRNA (cytosine1962-C5)-methyltransferase